jgi:anhydro-N-acetylmuramic acid kinase
MKTYKAVGIMSGSSLDGIDIAYCIFSENNQNWSYQLVKVACLDYEAEWQNKLKNIETLSALKFVKLDIELGHLFANAVQDFLSKNKLQKPDFICSHGHTAFHNPHLGYTSQIGNGAILNSQLETPVICDLRMQDVALGGNGAPIVPVGEKYLFPKHKVFLNVGGIANISIHQENKILAFDVCPANTLLNFYAQQLDKPFDEGGKFAKSGICQTSLLEELNDIPYSLASAPKSLSTEYIWENYKPILDKYSFSSQDFLATISEHIAIQIAKQVKNFPPQKILVTGGGALNTFLIERIRVHLKHWEIEVPDFETVFYKEALIMAFLGLLKLENIENVHCSVTGASRNSISGAVYG